MDLDRHVIALCRTSSDRHNAMKILMLHCDALISMSQCDKNFQMSQCVEHSNVEIYQT
jgi:hypothetical protein